MKVLFINTVCGRSSTGRIIKDINTLLQNEGNESLCIYGRYDAPKEMKSFKMTNKLSFMFHLILARLFDLQGRGSFFETINIIKVIRDYNPDIIHLHNLHGYYLNYKVLFKFLKKVNIPVIWTLEWMQTLSK